MFQNFKKYLPYVVGVVIFISITIIYFNPLFNGKKLKQGDIYRAAAMSKEVKDFRNANNNEEPLWTNSMFGGMPAYQISTIYSGNLLGHIDQLFHLYLPSPSGYLFLYFLGFFILLLCFEIEPWLAILGALAYGFSSYLIIIIEAGHNSKANAIGYLAPLLGGFILLYKNKYWLGFAITSLFMALEFNANHPQISYYGFLMFAVFALFYFINAYKNKTYKKFIIASSIFALSTIIGLLPNVASLYCTYEYSKYTIRSKSELHATTQNNNSTSGLDIDYATQWSYGVGESFSLLIPNFKGGATDAIARVNKDALKKVDTQFKEDVAQSNAYFGDQPFTSGPVYAGAVIMLLVFLGLLVLNHPLKWALFVCLILSLLLSWGRNFSGLTNFCMHVLPGYNKFRAVSMILVIAELIIPLIAILVLDTLIKKMKDGNFKIILFKKDFEIKKVILYTLAIVGVFCLINFLSPTTFNTLTASNEENELISSFKKMGASAEQINQVLPTLISNLEIARSEIVSFDSRRSLIFVILTGLFLYLFIIKRISSKLLIFTLGIFVLADMWPITTRYLNKSHYSTKGPYDEPPYKTKANQEILEDKTLQYRVLNLVGNNPFQDATTSYYHRSIGGYHGAKLRKYQELIDFNLSQDLRKFYTAISSEKMNDSVFKFATKPLQGINMMNTKYIIIPTSENNSFVLKNDNANGPAWFVSKINIVSSPDEELAGIAEINTKQEALMQTKYKSNLSSNTFNNNGSITITQYKPNHLIYQSNNLKLGFAVFSEIYYPKGWNAYIDGKQTEHVCVNYVLRGLEIPAGNHTIEFKFEPKSYSNGNKVAMVGSILLLISVGFSIYKSFSKKHL